MPHRELGQADVILVGVSRSGMAPGRDDRSKAVCSNAAQRNG